MLTFAGKIDFTTGINPSWVSIDDLNGDDKPDLAIANFGSANISVLLNTTSPGATTPTYADKIDFTTGAQPRSLSIGDLNGDGKPDLAVANYGSRTVSVLLNTTMPGASTPTFDDKSDFTAGENPHSVTVGDLNGDGKPDLAITNAGSGTVSILLNTTTTGASTPTFSGNTDLTTGAVPYSVAISDINDDGKPDLAIANFGSDTVSVLLNATPTGASTPTFSGKTDFTAGTNPISVEIGDLNDDGKPDLAIANYGSNNVSVLLSTTTSNADTPTYTDKTDFATGTTPLAVTIEDLNDDGKPDLVVANLNSNTVSVLLNTTPTGATTATYTGKIDFAAGTNPISAAIGDLNDDDKPDLVVANLSSNTVSVLLGATMATVTLPATGGTMTALIVDGILHVRRSPSLPDLISPLSLDHVSTLVIEGSNRDDRLTLDRSMSVFHGTITFIGGDGNDSLNVRAVGVPVVFDGGKGNDTFLGGSGNDSASGGVGRDSLSGGDGNDILFGGTGDDLLIGEAGNDTLVSEAGNDTLNGDSGNDEMFGGADNDLLNGGTGDNTLVGEAGNDTLISDTGNDILFGGAGNDSLNAGGGNNTLVGEAGSDTLKSGLGNDILFGGDGSDSLNAGAGNNTLVGEAGTDTLISGMGDDILFGGAGNDSLNAGAGNNTLFGEAGNDTLNGGTGNDVLDGGDDNDSVSGFDGGDSLRGGNGNDTLNGGTGDDTLAGDAGSDRLDGGAGNDVIDGGDDNDSLIGSDGNDSLRGGNGNDTLNGGNGDDLLTGSAGDDRLSGMSGNDTLLGDSGNDMLVGSTGIDIINPGPDTDHDIISDGTAIIDTSFAFDFDKLLADLL